MTPPCNFASRLPVESDPQLLQLRRSGGDGFEPASPPDVGRSPTGLFVITLTPPAKAVGSSKLHGGLSTTLTVLSKSQLSPSFRANPIVATSRGGQVLQCPIVPEIGSMTNAQISRHRHTPTWRWHHRRSEASGLTEHRVPQLHPVGNGLVIKPRFTDYRAGHCRMARFRFLIALNMQVEFGHGRVWPLK